MNIGPGHNKLTFGMNLDESFKIFNKVIDQAETHLPIIIQNGRMTVGKEFFPCKNDGCSYAIIEKFERGDRKIKFFRQQEGKKDVEIYTNKLQGKSLFKNSYYNTDHYVDYYRKTGQDIQRNEYLEDKRNCFIKLAEYIKPVLDCINHK